MTHPDLPENWEDLLAGYTLGNLSAEEAATVQQLLAARPELKADLDDLQAASLRLARVQSQAAAPAHLRDRVLAKASSMASPPAVSRIRDRRWRYGTAFAGSLAALIIATLAWDGYRLRQELRTTTVALRALQQQLQDNQMLVTALQESSQGIFLLQGSAAAAGASGNAVLTPNNGQIVISVRGLPTLPENQIYRLWAVVEGLPRPVFCGQFVPEADGTLTKAWETPPPVAESGAVEVFVTAEQAEDEKSPQGDVILQQVL